MKSKISNFAILAITILFFTLGFQALDQAKTEPKNERVYKELKNYMPYYLEKRIGGFSIMKKGSKTKEKPPITEVLSRLEQLEQGWGKEHLKLSNNDLIIMDENKTVIGKIVFQNQAEKSWVKKFFLISEHK
jgi:hypothetical protein